ncbi:MAG: 16S rRNA (adenine(1518)-N(6)/adenine(1519)-N(6))-dimethyltransferase RsmA [Mariprofundaceae bacterium]|nr:16S rRNA (adenine(1518)-N(6)/adenine(1519)-N(6))-dimethyltransferase RsmA [Mariprofundaceae bacterium]
MSESFRANKALGQHFLISEKAIRTIAEAIPQGQSAIEIGPGPGAITTSVLARVGHLTIIEKDDRFAEYWQDKTNIYNHLSVVHGDVLEVLESAVQQAQPDWIVGNLPYNISGPLTAQLASFSLTGGMILMYQREVGQRIVAESGSKIYGGLSVLVRHFYSPKRLITLPPGAFNPPPKVHSMVIQLLPHGNTPDCAYADLQTTVRQGFAHRRKTIFNQFRGELTQDDFISVNIDPQKRPEQLDYADWVKITLLRKGTVKIQHD